MKHIKTFENFVNEASNTFKEGDLVRWSNPKTVEETPALYGVIQKDRGRMIDLAVVGQGPHEEMGPTSTLMRRNNKIGWHGSGMSAEELLNVSDVTMPNLDKKFLTAWIP